jgi:hypothetical protein
VNGKSRQNIKCKKKKKKKKQVFFTNRWLVSSKMVQESYNTVILSGDTAISDYAFAFSSRLTTAFLVDVMGVDDRRKGLREVSP